jgi:hypothetical protein
VNIAPEILTRAQNALRAGDTDTVKCFLYGAGVSPLDVRKFIEEGGVSAPTIPVAVAEPEPDTTSTAFQDCLNYVSAIFHQGDTLCFVGIVHNKDRGKERVVNDFVSYEKAISREYFHHLQGANEEASIYLAMNTYPASLIGGHTGRTQENVAEVRAVQSDVDYNGEATMSAIKSSTLVPQPSIVVESSPGKFQGIWLVDNFTKEDAKPLMQAIAAQFNTDSAVAEIARVMRVPGFVNRKYESAPLARTLLQTGERYTRADFRVSLPEAVKFETKAENWVDDVVIQHGQAYNQLLSLAGYYVREKNISSPDMLYKLLSGHCENAVDRDGKTPWFPNLKQVREYADKWAKEFETGESIDARTKLTLNQSQSQQPQVSDDAKAKAQADYDALVEQCQVEEHKVQNPYPVDAWEGTPYHDFALLCRGDGRNENYIPKEYFINGMATTVGAICGNRIVPAFNPTLQARFITLLLSTKGGIGKNVVMEWSKKPFADTGLIYQSDLRQFTNIGCYVADFGSARGMADTMQRHPRILQEYAEFSTAVEKFSIAGSGDAFRDMILNLADGQVPNWSIIKGTKVSANAPKEISNSILAGTTTERFDEMMMKANWETFVQRLNLVPTDETKTKFKLVMPDLSSMQEKLLPRIKMLEGHKLVWTLSPESEALGENWFESLHDKVAEDDTESVGRIQVYLFRIISHLALWLAPLPTTVGVETTPDGRANAIWKYEVPVDVMKRAIRVAEHQVVARSVNMPVRGSTTAGVVENVITKWAFKNKSIRWIELKRRSKIARFGHKACHDALLNLQRSRVIFVQGNPEDENDQRDWVVVWAGSDGKHRKWRETRGGKRPGAGRKT